MANDLVSIIIPAYNVAAYIDKCIASACEQTYENVEVILVDDGSTDGITPGKCDDWATKDSRIKVIHKPNGGLSDARNAGLDAAKGVYIYFLDGDDYIKHELVETVLENFDENTSLVCFNYLPVDENGDSSYMPQPRAGIFDISSEDRRLKFILEVLLKHAVGWEAWNKMFRRDLIEKYNLRFVDNNKIFAEDQYFSTCYCLHASVVKSISDRLYYYVQRGNSIMGMYRNKINIDRISLLSEAVFEHALTSDDCAYAIKCYPILHYMLLQNEFWIMQYKMEMNRREIRNVILNKVDNKNFLFEHLRNLGRYRRELYNLFGSIGAERELVNVEYYIDGRYFASRVKNRVITWLTPLIMKKDPERNRLEDEYENFCKVGDKRIYLVGTEEYGNLGDHQINESSNEFLKSYFPEYVIKEVTIEEYEKHKRQLLKYIRPQDVIVMSGGGNFGDIYPEQEKLRVDIVATWNQNKKVILPQTIYYSDTPNGRELLEIGRKNYAEGNNLTIFARDHISYEFAKNNFSCDIYECPDIVMFSDKCYVGKRKNQILICMRGDIEKKLNADEQKRIIESAGAYCENIVITDTQLEYHVKKVDRKKAIEKIIDKYRNSKLVITDRLHGMVFAAITGTPCIALDNFNGKVLGTYNWIKYLPYIRYAKDADTAIGYIPELLNLGKVKYSNLELQPYYNKLAECISEKIKRS